MLTLLKAVIATVGLVTLAGCVSTQSHRTTNTFEKIDGDARVLLLEPDVAISFIKASEIREPRADWTEKAETNLVAALRTQLAEKDVSLSEFVVSDATPREIQLIKLHEAVGDTVIQHRFAHQPLPSKDNKFDWSLGPGVRELAANSDADYALLLVARGEYASAGKVVANLIFAAAGVGGGSAGAQLAFASLIDLRTGDIVWFNLAMTGVGFDMREESGAENIVMNLLKNAPL